jgi:hypothetical protein
MHNSVCISWFANKSFNVAYSVSSHKHFEDYAIQTFTNYG